MSDEGDVVRVRGQVVRAAFFPGFMDGLELVVATDGGGRFERKIQLIGQEGEVVTADGEAKDWLTLIVWLADRRLTGPGLVDVDLTLEGLTRYVPIVKAHFTTDKRSDDA